MVEVALPDLNSFASESPIDQPDPALFEEIPVAFLESLLLEIRELKDEVARQKKQITVLESGIETQEKDKSILIGRVNDLEEDSENSCAAIDNHANAINQVWQKVKSAPEQPQGRTTEKRLGDLDNILLRKGNQPLHGVEIARLLRIGTKDTERANMTPFFKVLADMPDKYIVHDLRKVGQKGNRRGKTVQLHSDYYNSLKAKKERKLKNKYATD